TILGVQAPWTVDRVDVDVAGGAVHVWLARTEGAPAPCPECQTACLIYDHREREWRHLDTCQLQTRLHARVPRVECPTHGVVQSAVPWATPGSKFTLLFERLAIDWLLEAAVTAVARQVKLGWDAVWGNARPGTRRRGEDRVRSLPLRQAPQRGRRSRATRRAPRAPGPRRHAADGHEVRLAAPSRSLHAGGVARVRGLTQQRAQGRPRLGAQGDG